jgi:pyrroline-5-carboxylate reductase
MKCIGIIGTGVMGNAIARGVFESDPETRIHLFDIVTPSAEELSRKVKGQVHNSARELIKMVKASDGIVILAVKPQQLTSLARSVEGSTDKVKCISIAAGCSIRALTALFPGTNMIRFMPNVAAKIGKSVVAVSAADAAGEGFIQEAKAVAQAIGHPVLLDESLLSAFTGLSGSGIAYVFSFIHAMALGGTENGIAYAKSLSIVLDTVLGAVELIKEDAGNPAEMITRVTSAGGTTIKGVAALERGAFTATVMNAVREAAEKAYVMEKGSDKDA